MFDIMHRLGVKASPRAVYDSLATCERLAGWWTSDTTGKEEVGGVIHFQFGGRGGFDMKVLELEPEKRVVWEVIQGPPDWVGTRVIWDLTPEGDGTTIRFKHQGWREQVDFMGHCSMKWGTFLMSLKQLHEAGKGAPFPNDVLISVDWD